MTTPPPDLLTVAELADHLGVKPSTVYHWRVRGYGPTAVKISGRVRYRLADVDAWVAEHAEETTR